jgi:probable F420-dependent oxidoreductase
MRFGVTHADAPAARTLELLRAAEDAQFDQFWVPDSHVIWQDAFTKLGWLVGQSRDTTMQFGTMVTNPVTRDPTVLASCFALLNELTGGRAICGIGRGDSVVRVLERKPAKLADVERAIEVVRVLGSGESLELDGVGVQIGWAHGRVPIYLAGYGPKALTLAGRVADGVVFQVADPYFISWGLGFVRAGAAEAGRDPEDIVVHCAAATVIADDPLYARDLVRWFPALVGNHVADVLRHHDPATVPDYVAEYVEARTRYDYYQHGHPGADHSKYVPDEIVDRFCVIGTVEECAAKLRELASVGVDEFNIYPYVPQLEQVIATYGREIAPRFRAAAVPT